MLTARRNSVHLRKTPLPRYTSQPDPRCARPNPNADCPIPYTSMPPMTITRVSQPIQTYHGVRNNLPRREPMSQNLRDAPPSYWNANHFREVHLPDRWPPMPAPPPRAAQPRRSGDQWPEERIPPVLLPCLQTTKSDHHFLLTLSYSSSGPECIGSTECTRRLKCTRSTARHLTLPAAIAPPGSYQHCELSIAVDLAKRRMLMLNQVA